MPSHYDLVILGAGSTGAAAARRAAEKGLSVCVLDRREREAAGAQWINEVPRWMFDHAGVPHPGAGEIVGHEHAEHHRVHMAFGGRLPALAVPLQGGYALDMRALVARLLSDAERSGAELRYRTSVRSVGDDGVVCTDHGTLYAGAVLDATGVPGFNALGLRPVAPSDLCAASQRLHAVRDVRGAERFVGSHGARLGDGVAFTGVHGGFSVLNVRWNGDTVSVLAGSIPARGHPSGGAIAERFVRDNPWIGDGLYGGARAIPLAAPDEPFARGRVAHAGDAARQVFAAHGSGTGSGLLAARLFVDALVDGAGPQGYAARWMRAHGPLHYTYDLFRRFSQTLSDDEMHAMSEAGLITPEAAIANLEQRWPSPSRSSAVATLRGAARLPRIVGRLARWMAPAPMLAALARTFPDEPAAQARAYARVRALYATLPDPDA